MTFVEKALVGCLKHVWVTLKAADAELTVYKTAVEALLENHPEVEADLTAFLTSARQSPAPPESIHAKYAPILGTLLRTLPETEPGEEARTELGLLENLD
jgi:hypothetical protein